MSQCDRLLEHLYHNGSISQLEAFSLLGICRLSERVRELERRGYRIAHTRTTVDTRYEIPARIVKYSLLGEPAHADAQA